MDKVKLYFDWATYDRLSTKATELAEYANTIAIPLLRAMEVPITWDNVLSTCRHPEHPRYYLEQHISGSKYERAAIKEQIKKHYEEEIQPYRGDLRRQALNGLYVEACNLNKEKIVEVNEKRLEDLSTVWLTDKKEINARKEHLELCALLTDFIKRSGIYPGNWQNLFETNINSGEISPAPFTNPYPTIANNSR